MAGLKIAARIDRIDEFDDLSHVIVDYKTGKALRSAWMGQRPDDPQLPLYAVTDAGPVAAVSFAVLRADQVAFEGWLAMQSCCLASPSSTRPRARSTRKLGKRVRRLGAPNSRHLAREFLAGHATVAPKNYPRTCEHCDLGALCRVREWLDRGPSSGEDDDAMN